MPIISPATNDRTVSSRLAIDISNPQAGDTLTFDGTKWVNGAATASSAPILHLESWSDADALTDGLLFQLKLDPADTSHVWEIHNDGFTFTPSGSGDALHVPDPTRPYLVILQAQVVPHATAWLEFSIDLSGTVNNKTAVTAIPPTSVKNVPYHTATEHGVMIPGDMLSSNGLTTYVRVRGGISTLASAHLIVCAQ